MFQDLGCSAHDAKAIMDSQGIDTLDDCCILKDGELETLCKNVKHPGGTVEVITVSQSGTSRLPKD